MAEASSMTNCQSNGGCRSCMPQLYPHEQSSIDRKKVCGKS
jgi:hypothetical protein